MKTKSLLFAGVVMLSTLAFARTKSYEITFSQPVHVKNVEIAPGDYKMTIQGTNAVFNEEHNGKSFTLPVKIETVSTKFDATAFNTMEQGNVRNLVAIDLGGSKTKLDFGQ